MSLDYHLKHSADGHLMYNATGHLVNKCPCDDALRDAIRKRQQAIGIANAWSAAEPTEYATHLIATCDEYFLTIAELKDFINHLAPYYLDGTWTGGSATNPPRLTDTYADSATTEAELYALVCDMVTTLSTWMPDSHSQNWPYHGMSELGEHGWLGYGNSVGNGSGWCYPPDAEATAKSETDSTWAVNTDNGWGGALNADALIYEDGGAFKGHKGRQAVKWGNDGFWSGCGKTVDIYGLFDDANVNHGYAKLGDPVPDEEAWGLLNSHDLGTAASYAETDWWPTNLVPNGWGPTPTAANWGVGYSIKYLARLTTWEFNDP